jgi:hypothetical protein
VLESCADEPGRALGLDERAASCRNSLPVVPIEIVVQPHMSSMYAEALGARWRSMNAALQGAEASAQEVSTAEPAAPPTRKCVFQVPTAPGVELAMLISRRDASWKDVRDREQHVGNLGGTNLAW